MTLPLSSDMCFAVIPEWVIDSSMSHLAFRLYAVLRRYADNTTGFARPGRKTIADRMGLSVKTVDRGLKELEDLGVIQVHTRWHDPEADTYAFARDSAHHVQAPNGYILRSIPLASGGDKTVAPSKQVFSADAPPIAPEQADKSVQQGATDLSEGATELSPGGASELSPELEPLELEIKDSSAKPPRTKPRASIEPPRADVDALCERLSDRLIDNGNKPPKITEAWRREARLLLDKDGRDLDKALRLIDWCQQDSFWRSNIMSMEAFRRQYDRLRQKAIPVVSNRVRTSGYDGGRAWQE